MHNGERHLDACLESLRRQTFEDFEIVVLENGSTDASRDILRRWEEREPRLRVHHAPGQMPGARSFRAAVELTTAPIVVRIDDDDIAHPERIERQVGALVGDPGASLVTAMYCIVDERARVVRPRDRWPLVSRRHPMPFPGSSMAFRREAYDRVGGYRDVRGPWEDLELAYRLGEVGRVLVLPQALQAIRFDLTSRSAVAAVGEEAMASARERETATQAQSGRRTPHSDARLAAATLLELASMELWTGRRPTHARALLRRAPRAGGLWGAAATVWAALALASPRALRAVLVARSRARDRLAVAMIGEDPREWRFG